MKSPKLYIGTAGWSYKDWHPSFYPFTQTKGRSWLQFYSTYFNMVEVNATYYTYLKDSIVKSWLKQTEEHPEFQFTVKLHNDFTHKRNYGTEEIKRVKDNLELLKAEDKLGGILIQFPYSFDCNDASIDYLRCLIETFEEYNKFVEVRHKSWQNKKAKTVTFCTIDQPQVGESIEFNPVAGNKMAYIRFHGRNTDAWRKSITDFGKKQSYDEQNARYQYLYSPGELVEIEQKLKEIYDKVNKIFIVMNNHPKGDAVANAFELLHFLKNRIKIKMPDTILKSYPRLKEFAIN
ncbi:MAG: DUF72 domain-containing protein [Melioribacteraceae bacterium]|nr:DUF72 domain-containing protein [Melioribacteraceae bacterium]MCF8412151.1 DUF72 domain-containing protein [Melioribacteraceae bacterium]MCF8432231.1 DUF72 domain-containing protein [Melioribacteraceae bacterium]